MHFNSLSVCLEFDYAYNTSTTDSMHGSRTRGHALVSSQISHFKRELITISSFNRRRRNSTIYSSSAQQVKLTDNNSSVYMVFLTEKAQYLCK